MMDQLPSSTAPVLTTGGALARLQQAEESGVSPAIAIMLDDVLFAQVQRVANLMAAAEGFVPQHLVGKPQVCFAVVSRALVWKLDPFAVAQSTYQPTEGGKVAYEAKLVQAIMEQSGRLVGGIKREYFGDWSKVHGRFKIVTNEKEYPSKYAGGKTYTKTTRTPERDWSDEDEIGLGIRLTIKLKDRDVDPVELELRQAHPRNSTLWATDPALQLYYRAIRLVGNVACPSLIMGVPFVGELDDPDPATRARDVSPQPAASGSRLDAFTQQHRSAPLPPVTVDHDEDGVVPDAKEEPQPDAQGQPAQEPQAPQGWPVVVTLTFPGPENSRRIVDGLEPTEAAAQLMAMARQAVGRKGLSWCDAALALNPWIASLGDVLDELTSIRETCRKSAEGK